MARAGDFRLDSLGGNERPRRFGAQASRIRGASLAERHSGKTGCFFGRSRDRLILRISTFSSAMLLSPKVVDGGPNGHVTSGAGHAPPDRLQWH
jgi:hypothetical protein